VTTGTGSNGEDAVQTNTAAMRLKRVRLLEGCRTTQLK